MSVYFIANIAVRDDALYQKYLERVDEVFEKFQGRYLALDTAPTVLEGAWPYSRVALITFPDQAALDRWYGSPEYQEILAFRLGAADCDTIVAHGSD